MAYESHSLDLFGLYARNLGGNRGEVPVGIVWIIGADAMSRKLSSLNGRAPRTGGDVRYFAPMGAWNYSKSSLKRNTFRHPTSQVR